MVFFMFQQAFSMAEIKAVGQNWLVSELVLSLFASKKFSKAQSHLISLLKCIVSTVYRHTCIRIEIQTPS